jgi:peptide deformylase
MNLAEPNFVEKIICTEVTDAEAPELIKLGEQMIQECTKLGGIGLAAPQIGIPKRMFVWRIGQTDDGNDMYQIVFNPKYYKDKKKTRMIEGCLSYKEKHFITERAKAVQAVYYTYAHEKMIKITNHLSGIKAVIFQHETDHVDGITIALNGEELSEQKNKEFVESFQRAQKIRNSGSNIQNDDRNGSKESEIMGGGGSAAVEFVPNK